MYMYFLNRCLIFQCCQKKRHKKVRYRKLIWKKTAILSQMFALHNNILHTHVYQSTITCCVYLEDRFTLISSDHNNTKYL